MSLSPGTRLGPYEILSPLGAGGMGEVYRARDPRLSREVAVKVLPQQFSADRDRLQRFEREAQAAGALNHPNILAIFDIGSHEGAAYLVTELLEGETLRAELEGAPFSPRKAIGYALQIAHGLEAAHTRGIVHRDLKPDNLFVTDDGRVKILDFGLAKVAQDSSPAEPGTQLPTKDRLTEPGMVLGTLGYMSPEQVRGKPADARSDIFSFGAILYEMLYGRRAFHAETAADTMSAILTREPAEVRQPASDVAPGLARVVRHCLEKNPDRRFQSAHDLAFDLETVSGITGPSSPAQVEPTTVPVSRLGHPALILVGLLALAAVAAGLFTLRRQGPAAAFPGIHSLAVLPFVNASGDPDAEYLGDGITESLINNLAQLPDLTVMSRSTAFRYKGRDGDIETISRDLKVQAVLTGRVTQRGQDLTISAELVDAANNSHIWGDRYNRKMSDLLAIQDEIAREISGALKLKLTGEGREKISRRSTGNTEAYRLYLQGRYFWNQRGKFLAKSIPYFEQALEKDPGYALAYAGLADAYSLLGWYGYAPSRETLPKAKAAVEKALQIDDSLAEAHCSLGFIHLYDERDPVGALREIDRALVMDPSYAPAHYWRASVFASTGRVDEAVAEDRRGVEGEPLSVFLNTHLGWMLFDAERYDDAAEQLKRSLDLNSGVLITHFLLGQVYAAQSRFDDAIAEMNRALEISGDSPWMKGTLGYIYALAGRKDDARKVLAELKQRSSREYVRPMAFAMVHTGLGEKDQAIQWLQKAEEERDVLVVGMDHDPTYRTLRDDPRFIELVKRVGVAGALPAGTGKP